MTARKRICWVTATWFLDVDLPIVPELTKEFDIDWYVISSTKQKEDDVKYIKSKTDIPFSLVVNDNIWFSLKARSFCNTFFKSIADKEYDWYYVDYSSFLYGYQAIARHLPLDRTTLATHNVSTPKGARLEYLARYNMRFATHKFKHFQVFSKNQQSVLESVNKNADIFYCPLALKDYGDKHIAPVSSEENIPSFSLGISFLTNDWIFCCRRPTDLLIGM